MTSHPMNDTVSEDVKLLPCPHCGEAEHLYPAYRNMGDAAPYAIDCIGCGADFTPREGKDVIAAWNRRAYLAATKPPLADVTELKQAIWDAVERHIDGTPLDGINAAGDYSEDVYQQQRMYVAGL